MERSWLYLQQQLPGKTSHARKRGDAVRVGSRLQQPSSS